MVLYDLNLYIMNKLQIVHNTRNLVGTRGKEYKTAFLLMLLPKCRDLNVMSQSLNHKSEAEDGKQMKARASVTVFVCRCERENSYG